MNKSKYVSHYGNHPLATWLNSVLWICCSVKNYHKCSCLKQHAFLISQFLQVQSLCMTYLGSLLQDLLPVCNRVLAED